MELYLAGIEEEGGIWVELYLFVLLKESLVHEPEVP